MKLRVVGVGALALVGGDAKLYKVTLKQGIVAAIVQPV